MLNVLSRNHCDGYHKIFIFLVWECPKALRPYRLVLLVKRLVRVHEYMNMYVSVVNKYGQLADIQYA